MPVSAGLWAVSAAAAAVEFSVVLAAELAAELSVVLAVELGVCWLWSAV